MEFFQTLPDQAVDTDALKRTLTLANLPALCASIDTSQARDPHEGEIYCLWGTFRVRRDELVRGVRFSLLNCPHALAWSITHAPSTRRLVIHCTIDKIEPDAEFAASIDGFVRDWADGVRRALR